MAQIRMRDFKEPLTSFNHNLMQLRNRPGRYTGFDTIQQTSALGFNISHIMTGQIYRDDAQANVGPMGALMTTQGVYILETSAVGPLSIDTNAGNGVERTDLVVCNHQFINIDGGQPATYSIVKGFIGDPSPQNLPNPDYQTIIGRITIPPNATDLNQCTYNRERCPDSGDGPDARLDSTNRFNTLNQQNVSPTAYTTSSDQENMGGLIGWLLRPDANTFDLSYGSTTFIDFIRTGTLQTLNGTTITIQINSNVTIRNNTALPAGASARGFANILLPPMFANKMVTLNSTRVLAFTPTTVTKWNISLLKVDNQWVVIGVEGTNDTIFKRGMIIDTYFADEQDIIDNFDNTGKGINLYVGWAICNGLNGTQDLRGRFTVGVTNAPGDGANSIPFGIITDKSRGQMGGEETVTLTLNQIPHHNHQITGTNQGHNAGGGSIPAANFTGAESAGFTEGNGGGQSHNNLPPFFAAIKLQRIV